MKHFSCIALSVLFLCAFSRNAKSQFAFFSLEKDSYLSTVPANGSAPSINLNLPAVQGLSVDISYELQTDTSMVRVILQTQTGKEYLVCEINNLYAPEHTGTQKNICDETYFIAPETPSKIVIETISASANIQAINYQEIISAQAPKLLTNDFAERKADRLNLYLETQGKLWRAGTTPLAEMNYEEKKAYFGGKVPNLCGAEYYIGGIFEIGDISNAPATSNESKYVDEYDLRNRHGIHWPSPVKNQGGCGSCWAFAGTATIEQAFNLYYNKKYDLDLSEQQSVSCTRGSCDGGWAYLTYDLCKESGIVPEACFPYSATNSDCSETCQNPAFRVTIEDYDIYYSNYDEEFIKSQILKSAVSFSIASWSHALSVVGYKKLNVGDKIYIQNGYSSLVINEGSEYVGKTVWILKNSWGKYWGMDGYLYLFSDLSNIRRIEVLPQKITSTFTSESDRMVVDNDNDGYYVWGQGEKPAHSPACSNFQDGDDSNPEIGPVDNYGKPLKYFKEMTIEAEDCRFDHATFENTHPGYSSEGYIDGNYNDRLAYIEFDLDLFAPIDCELFIHGVSERPCEILINQKSAGTFQLPKSANWSDWKKAITVIQLKRGKNTIRIKPTSAQGLPNIDKFTLNFPQRGEFIKADEHMSEIGYDNFIVSQIDNEPIFNSSGKKDQLALVFNSDNYQGDYSLFMRYKPNGDGTIHKINLNFDPLMEENYRCIGDQWETIEIPLTLTQYENIIDIRSTNITIDDLYILGRNLNVVKCPVQENIYTYYEKNYGYYETFCHVDDEEPENWLYYNIEYGSKKGFNINIFAIEETKATIHLEYSGEEYRYAYLSNNGEIIQNYIGFPPTTTMPNDTYWKQKTITFPLQKGMNQIKLKSMQDLGLHNIYNWAFITTNKLIFNVECEYADYSLIESNSAEICFYAEEETKIDVGFEYYNKSTDWYYAYSVIDESYYYVSTDRRSPLHTSAKKPEIATVGKGYHHVYIDVYQNAIELDKLYIYGKNITQTVCSEEGTPALKSMGNVEQKDKDTLISEELLLSPTPAANRLTVTFSSPKAEEAQHTITNTAGTKAWEQTNMLNKGTNNKTIDINNLPNGVYYYTVKSNSVTYKKAFTIIH